MIWVYILKLISSLLALVFSFLPKVVTLPMIGGFDVDSAMVTTFGYFHYITSIFPPFATLFYAMVFFYTYKVTMLTLRLLRIIR
jgi:hypothetical protein